MSAANSSTPATSDKPAKPSKPYPEFPLTAHPVGYWCKKIRGKLHYFGKWDDPDAALTKYLEQKDALHAGRKPREDTEGLTVKQLSNALLNAKQALVDGGELSPRTWEGYMDACELLVSAFGKSRLVSDLRPDDFATLRNRLAATRGPHWLGNTVQYMRSVFKYAFDSDLIPSPVRFGPGFKRPTKKTFRVHRAQQGPKLFTADEVRRLIDNAGTPMKAMILLGINCGYGNSDCGNLPLTALDLEHGIIDYPRPKTGILRRAILWPEVVQALKEGLADRPEPRSEDHAGLVFITKYGQPWSRDDDPAAITKEFVKLLRALGISGRKGLGFYTLRHTFRTVADESKDQAACDFIMGHEVPHMSSVYRETISDARLKAVSDYVHSWLFAPEPKPETDTPADEAAPQILPMVETA
jgi:integrase